MSEETSASSVHCNTVIFLEANFYVVVFRKSKKQKKLDLSRKAKYSWMITSKPSNKEEFCFTKLVLEVKNKQSTFLNSYFAVE